MQNGHYVAAAILAGGLMTAEAAVARARGRRAYDLRDTIASLGTFAGELVLTTLLYFNVFLAYGWLEQRIALVSLPARSPITWVVAFVAVDFSYYWAHRLCHRVAILWALHAVHHQSGHYNLGVGLRGPWLSALQIAPFMIPLAAAGIPSEALFPIYAAHTVWKLLVHTPLVGRLGVLEHVLVTPSLHRVHHGRNAHYLDRNFGGVLIVWDRLFGTHQIEDVAPEYGPVPAVVYDPLRSNLAPFRSLALRFAGARGASGRVRALLAPPSDDLADHVVPEPLAPLPRRARLYLIAQFAVVAIATLALLGWGDHLAWPLRFAAGAWIVYTIACLSPIAEARPKAMALEPLRLAAGAVLLITSLA
jgi:alkylglycerol monooxygenase